MDETHILYARARADVVDADAALTAAIAEHGTNDDETPEVVELTRARDAWSDAFEVFRNAEEPLRDVIDSVWETNRVAVQDAVKAVEQHRQQLAAVEVECGNAARNRNAVRPVLNDAEITRVQSAWAALADAKTAHEAAKTAFKDGVTVEQIASAG